MHELVMEGRKALVVEDDHDYAAFLEIALQQVGFEVTVAHDGVQALELVGDEAPDIVTLDIQMPRETGLMFYRRARAMPTMRAVPVVVVTGITPGDPDMSLLVRSMLQTDSVPPPNAFLEKPVTVRGLQKRVVNAVLAAQEATE